MKTLPELLAAVPSAREAGPDVEVHALTDDSRRVEPGSLFVAVRGGRTDGHHHLAEAAKAGAVAAIVERSEPAAGLPTIRVSDSRLALAQLAAAWHGFPARKLVMIGVTGTDGKTTATNLIYQILHTAGVAAGMITSVNALIGETSLDTGFHVTTPQALHVQNFLSRMVEAGLTHCVLEATSHGLAQQRVAACEFDVGVVTNISHEHLDFHGSFEEYRAAKGRLFAGLTEGAAKPFAPEKTAILNRDDASYEFLESLSRARQISYGLEPPADVRAEAVQQDAAGLRFEAVTAGSRVEVRSPLIGGYNVSNCLAALATAVGALGLTPEQAAQGIAALASVPGRMERLALGQRFTAIVDFAHTPNALQRALQASRHLSQGRVIAVFGSAGLRDRAKRRMMAEVSAELADVTILTAEDPRTESLEAILDEMVAAASAVGAREGEDLFRVADRGEALRRAVSMAKAGDLVIACGKGHEQSMCFGETEFPWDDRLALRAALAEHMGIPGPSMPVLPTSSGS